MAALMCQSVGKIWEFAAILKSQQKLDTDWKTGGGGSEAHRQSAKVTARLVIASLTLSKNTLCVSAKRQPMLRVCPVTYSKNSG